MKKWFWILICTILISSMLLTACGAAVTPTPADNAVPVAPASSEPVTIRFFHKWPEPEQLDYYNYDFTAKRSGTLL